MNIIYLLLSIIYLILIQGEIVAIGVVPLVELCISSVWMWLKNFPFLIFPYRVSLSCIIDDPSSEINNHRYWSMCCLLIFPDEFIFSGKIMFRFTMTFNNVDILKYVSCINLLRKSHYLWLIIIKLSKWPFTRKEVFIYS